MLRLRDWTLSWEKEGHRGGAIVEAAGVAPSWLCAEVARRYGGPRSKVGGDFSMGYVGTGLGQVMDTRKNLPGVSL